MTRLMVPVSKKNYKFVLYNHLFSRQGAFSIEDIQRELQAQYGLHITKEDIRYEVQEYLDCGLVMHSFNKYISCMQ